MLAQTPYRLRDFKLESAVKVDEIAWKWVKVDENGWKWMKMDENGWKWMKMDGNGWKWMKVDEHGWTWMKVDKSGWNGWKWMKIYVRCKAVDIFRMVGWGWGGGRGALGGTESVHSFVTFHMWMDSLTASICNVNIVRKEDEESEPDLIWKVKRAYLEIIVNLIIVHHLKFVFWSEILLTENSNVRHWIGQLVTRQHFSNNVIRDACSTADITDFHWLVLSTSVYTLYIIQAQMLKSYKWDWVLGWIGWTSERSSAESTALLC